MELKLKQQSGFTLVELAIVMVIIGLLIGGILKGQELIETSKVNSSINQLKSASSAIMMFEDKYNAVAGDIVNPGVRIPNCTTAPCNVAGDGNGHLNNNPCGTPLGTESVAVFSQLSAANFVLGIDPSKGLTAWGGFFPSFPAGGGMIASYAPTGAPIEFCDGGLWVDTTGISTGKYFSVYAGSPDTGGSVPLTPTQAHQIDMKLDDGNPAAGNVRAISIPGQQGFTKGVGARYLEEGQASCGLVVHF